MCTSMIRLLPTYRFLALSVDQKSIQQRYDELATVYKDKSRKHAQTQQLYDMLKKKVLMKQVETAASDSVTHTLQTINTQQRPATYQNQSYGHGISSQKTASENNQFEELAIPQRHKQPVARASFGHSEDMLPPPGSARSCGIGKLAIRSCESH